MLTNPDEKAKKHLKEEQRHYIISPGADGAVLCGETGASARAAGAVAHGGSATGRWLSTWRDTTNEAMKHYSKDSVFYFQMSLIWSRAETLQ